MSSMTLSSALRSMAEVAFTRSKSATPTPATVTEETSSTAAESSDKDKEVDANSDAALSLSSSYPSFASFKDQRAYEHDRQRIKRSQELARMREGKATRALLKMSQSPVSLSAKERKEVSSRKERRLGSGMIEEDETGQAVHDVLGGVRVSGKKEPYPSRKSEVKLADLIASGSIRKSQKNKDADFEVIPAVRSVIVLDELAFMQDTPRPRDLAQDWEHVNYSDSTDSPRSVVASPLTYAKVVIGGSQ